MAITALGSASGLDLESLVKQLVTVEQTSKQSRLDSTQKSLDASLSGVGKLKSALTKFQDALNALGEDKLSTRTATVKQPDDKKTYISATSSSSVAPGSFDIKVNSVASGSRLETTDNLFTASSNVVSTTAGKLNFAAGDKSFSIDVKAGMTLEELRQAINDKSDNFGVSANIINAGAGVGTKLVFNSSIKGAGNDLTVTNNNEELDKVSTSATGVGPAGFTVSSGAKDAEIEVDGITIKSSSNVFSNAIQGVELTVLAETPTDNNASLTIATDKTGAKNKINGLISAYNALIDEVNTLTAPRSYGNDGKTVTSEGGALSADPTVRSIMSQLSSALGGVFNSGGASANTLYAAGITFNSSGKMEISSSNSYGTDSGVKRLDALLENDYDNLVKMFGGEGGVVETLSGLTKEFTQRGGLLEYKETSIKSQIKQNTKAQEAFDRYIESYETTLRQLFGSLDSQLGQLQNTSSFLTSQLASLPKFGG